MRVKARSDSAPRAVNTRVNTLLMARPDWPVDRLLCTCETSQGGTNQGHLYLYICCKWHSPLHVKACDCNSQLVPPVQVEVLRAVRGSVAADIQELRRTVAILEPRHAQVRLTGFLPPAVCMWLGLRFGAQGCDCK